MNLDSDLSPITHITTESAITPESLERATASLLISASGWRKVFASDGNEHSASPTLHPDDPGLVIAIAEAFHEYLRDEERRQDPSGDMRSLVVATDSRPTGPAIAHIATRLFLGRGRDVEYLGVCTIPAVIAYTAERRGAGFLYISASHNPLGHNGVKFGGPDGAVLPGTAAHRIAERFHEIAKSPEQLQDAAHAVRAAARHLMAEIRDATDSHVSAAATAYRRATLRIASADESSHSQGPSARTESMLAGFRRALSEKPLGILADFNGSARAASIDVEFLSSLGVSMQTMNETPGAVAHRIVPEGEGLEPCARRLEQLYRQDPAVTVGYVPDNDGDRGNILYIDEDSGTARPIHAQAVFALACLAELLWLRATGVVETDENGCFIAPVAVVANGPTSMRVDEIARSFGAEVHRAEVGEANVVGLARLLREQGYTVRILGEGSNGGTITHPGVVRDPLQTILAMLKLTRFRDVAGATPLFGTWNEAPYSALPDDYLPSITELLESLPAYTSTGAYEERAILRITGTNHAKLKAAYEHLFSEDWKQRKEALDRNYGISSWHEINYEGYEARVGIGPEVRSGQEKGGLKIVLNGHNGEEVAFMWMRGSGTEPVYRILVDAGGTDTTLHDELLAWQTDLVRRADARAAF